VPRAKLLFVAIVLGACKNSRQRLLVKRQIVEATHLLHELENRIDLHSGVQHRVHYIDMGQPPIRSQGRFL